MSRLIIKNLPSHLTNAWLKEHFENHGVKVTDAKIVFRDGRSWWFGFLGVKNEQECKKVIEEFNKTFIDTNKIEIEEAKAEEEEPRESKDHSAKNETKPSLSLETDEKKKKFEEFVKVMNKKTEKVKT